MKVHWKYSILSLLKNKCDFITMEINNGQKKIKKSVDRFYADKIYWNVIDPKFIKQNITIDGTHTHIENLHML